MRSPRDSKRFESNMATRVWQSVSWDAIRERQTSHGVVIGAKTKRFARRVADAQTSQEIWGTVLRSSEVAHEPRFGNPPDYGGVYLSRLGKL
jgi:hypothetical protein